MSDENLGMLLFGGSCYVIIHVQRFLGVKHCRIEEHIEGGCCIRIISTVVLNTLQLQTKYIFFSIWNYFASGDMYLRQERVYRYPSFLSSKLGDL